MAYITRQTQYEGQDGWALVALLTVVERFSSHAIAAAWYEAKEYALPSNCIVPGNSPQPYRLTNRTCPAEVKARFDPEADPERAVRLWDAMYAGRARECGWFLACKADFMELWRPPVLRRADLIRIFGRVPGTQNPPQITSEEFHALTTFANESPG